MIDASIIIPCFNRKHLLEWHLRTLLRYNNQSTFEIIVLNDYLDDDGTHDICHKYGNDFIIRYAFTGQRNTPDNIVWRVPGFANNIGVRMAQSEIIILTCPEIYHFKNTIDLMVKILNKYPKSLATPGEVIDDYYGIFLNAINSKIKDEQLYVEKVKANNRQIIDGAFIANRYEPFFMGMMKSEFVSIGGYDEDFIGIACEDTDLTKRLLSNGLEFKFIDAEVMHLFHGIRTVEDKLNDPRYLYNKKLYDERKGQVIRNHGREWGSL